MMRNAKYLVEPSELEHRGQTNRKRMPITGVHLRTWLVKRSRRPLTPPVLPQPPRRAERDRDAPEVVRRTTPPRRIDVQSLDEFLTTRTPAPRAVLDLQRFRERRATLRARVSQPGSVPTPGDRHREVSADRREHLVRVLLDLRQDPPGDLLLRPLEDERRRTRDLRHLLQPLDLGPCLGDLHVGTPNRERC